MVDFKCFFCGKKVEAMYVKRRVRCPFCGSKVIYKERVRVTRVLAR